MIRASNRLSTAIWTSFGILTIDRHVQSETFGEPKPYHILLDLYAETMPHTDAWLPGFLTDITSLTSLIALFQVAMVIQARCHGIAYGWAVCSRVCG